MSQPSSDRKGKTSSKGKPKGVSYAIAHFLFSFTPFPGFLFSIIWLLRCAVGDSPAMFAPLTLYLLIFHQFIRISLNFMHTWSHRGHWRHLWVDKSFHFLLFLLALLAANTYSLIFCLIACIFFLDRCCKVIAFKIAPMLKGCTVFVRRVVSIAFKSDFLDIVRATLEIVYCPYLLLCMVDEFSVPISMAAGVSVIVYLPFAFIVQKSHRYVWKRINIFYTQLALESKTALFGTVMFTVLDRFRAAVDLLFAMYPAKFLERMERDIEMHP